MTGQDAKFFLYARKEASKSVEKFNRSAGPWNRWAVVVVDLDHEEGLQSFQVVAGHCLDQPVSRYSSPGQGRDMAVGTAHGAEVEVGSLEEEEVHHW